MLLVRRVPFLGKTLRSVRVEITNFPADLVTLLLPAGHEYKRVMWDRLCQSPCVSRTMVLLMLLQLLELL